MADRPSTILRRMLEGPEIVVLPGAYDALSARLAERAGFSAMFTTGFGFSASVLGQPDFGLLTMSETMDRVRHEASVAIADGARVIVLSDRDSSSEWAPIPSLLLVSGVHHHLIRTGVRTSTAPLIATMDGDGQNDPHDIMKLAALLDRSEHGTIALAGGVRVHRRARSSKRIASKAANWLRMRVLDDRCPDTGCGIKVFRRDVFLDLPYFSGMHRYLPALFQAYGYETTYHAVNDRPRRAGVSKFNWRRIPVGVLDLLSVWFQLRFGRKPMLFFGLGGAVLFLVGFLAGIVALVLRFGYGIGFRPLLNLVETMVISGIVLFGFGLLGEMIAGMREEQREFLRLAARDDHRGDGPA